MGFWTLPDLRHPVHTLTRLGEPSTMARTRWMFGFQRRFVRRCEWLRLMPKLGFLLQISHTEDIGRAQFLVWEIGGVRDSEDRPP